MTVCAERSVSLEGEEMSQSTFVKRLFARAVGSVLLGVGAALDLGDIGDQPLVRIWLRWNRFVRPDHS